ncbi:hypothetical protein [Reichenbachiella agariperforans]|uniref:hypothetical protein n=1 Tax=Reichenbachiella agariperforans TaxID=156994 RepID=UPI001C098B46|nr:hypothetical protein [Reichenbachiella agariperforans]MBU2913537.1 hypothetical protein [Reichenbachiella agariperforans]
MKKVKMIWDMRGGDAKGMAEHHAIHLKEYAAKWNMTLHEAGTEVVNDAYIVAYMIIDESDMITVRDNLRPHRAEYAE